MIVNKLEVTQLTGILVVRAACCAISKTWTTDTGDTHLLTKMKCVLATALVPGTATGAMARGTNGSVMLGSLDGVNPADHPAIFDNPGVAASYAFVKTSHGWAVARSHVHRSND
jgi:hypothetical protein